MRCSRGPAQLEHSVERDAARQYEIVNVCVHGNPRCRLLRGAGASRPRMPCHSRDSDLSQDEWSLAVVVLAEPAHLDQHLGGLLLRHSRPEGRLSELLSRTVDVKALLSGQDADRNIPKALLAELARCVGRAFA